MVESERIYGTSMKKTAKRIGFVLLGIVLAIVVGYFVWSGFKV